MRNLFKDEYPELFKELDIEKNIENGIDVNKITSGSGKKLYFRCSKNHSYSTIVRDKCRQNHGCPICAGQKVLKGFNDLETKFPEIAKEWDLSKNNGKLPSEFTYGSGHIADWICPKGHSYRMDIHLRTSKKNSCPICAGKQVLKGYNDFESQHPELMDSWNWDKNTVKPDEIISQTHKKVWWKCPECGHEWESTSHTRIQSNCGCPKCQISKGEKAIEEYLKNNNINYTCQFSFKDCKNKFPLLFDFAILDSQDKLKFLIEYDGEQHYRPWRKKDGPEMLEKIHKRDSIKNNYCKDNNIPLYRIPYWEFENIENVLDRIFNGEYKCIKNK